MLRKFGSRSTRIRHRDVDVVIFIAALAVLIAIGVGLWQGVLESNELHRERFTRDLMMQQVEKTKDGQADGLHFYDVPNPDAILAEIEPLEGLKYVSFDSCPVTPAGLSELGRQPNFRVLTFNALDDALMVAIAELPNLEKLNIKYCQLTDSGVDVVAGNLTLRSLTLTNGKRGDGDICHMTETAIDNLQKHQQRREIRLQGNWFTDEAVESLREALPNCDITFDHIE